MSDISTDKTDDPEAEQTPRVMYLSELQLNNFRSCLETNVKLQPDLTLIVGENNAGKSNIIEALRLATSPLSRRRTRYFEIEDVSKIATEDRVELQTTFEGLSEFQLAQYICAVNVDDKKATYRTTYIPNRLNRRKSRVESAAGLHGTTDPEPEKREQINHVYLAPLRDANRELDSAAGNRLALIMETLLTKTEMDDFLKDAKNSYAKINEHKAIEKTKNTLQDELTLLTDAARKQHVDIALDSVVIERLTRSLRIKMSEHEIDFADLAHSGLGYANLLFLASVVLELSTIDESELTLFLVEEPEAHLHPQLQAVLLDYLQDQARKSVRKDDTGPAGRIQVIATTHSPNLASSAGIDAIVVAQSQEAKTADGQTAQQSTKCIALVDLDLSSQEHRKVDQYLDVTRAELLFARNVILVEGLAEQVIIPALARRIILAGDDEEMVRLRRRFRGVSIISVGSVDFTPYIKLLLQEVNGLRLADQVVIITDGDPELPKEAASESEEEQGEKDDTVKYNRTSALADLLTALGANKHAYIATAPYTLEADLLTAEPSDLTVVKKAFLDQKPNSTSTWNDIVGSSDPAKDLYTRLRKNKKFLSKGQFAHDFAYYLEKEPVGYVSPDYISAAVKHIVKDHQSEND